MNDVGASLVNILPADPHDSAIVCIPQAGGGAASFVPLARILQGDAEVWAARFPGREGRIRERPLTSIEDMAGSLIDTVRGIGARNIIFFGHCSGAYVAYELAAMLAAESRQWPNAWLVVSGQVAPAESGEVGGMEAGGPRRGLADALRDLGGTPEALFEYPELWELLAPAIEADFRAAERYGVPRQRRRLTMPIAVLAGRDDEFLRDSDLLAWRRCTTGCFRMQLFDGDHFFLSRQVQAIGQYLMALLREGPA